VTRIEDVLDGCVHVWQLTRAGSVRSIGKQRNSV
jgi:hypothetical protein